MLQIAVLDDLTEHTETLAAMVAVAMHDRAYALTTYTNPADFLSEAIKTARFDIVFLDIVLKQTDGVEVARQINSSAPCMQVIFISAHLNRITQIYDAKHVYFLAKPVQRDHLEKALTRAIAAVDALKNAQIKLPLCGGGWRLTGASEIVCCERVVRTTRIALDTNQTLSTPLRIKELQAQLPDDRFACPHASFLVSLGCVRTFSNNSVQLSNGTLVPISAHRKASFMRALENYIL